MLPLPDVLVLSEAVRVGAVLVALLLVTSGGLAALTRVVNGWSRLRRAVRRERIAARDEGWGGRPSPERVKAELDRSERHPFATRDRRTVRRPR